MRQPLAWDSWLDQQVQALLAAQPLAFRELTGSKIPSSAGVYVITDCIDGAESAAYVGRSTNLSQRLYAQHLMGALSNARLKKYLIEHGVCSDKDDAKQYIRQNCHVRWILEPDYRKRGAVEGYVTAVLFPKYGIEHEH
jgi:hypothetical protein